MSDDRRCCVHVVRVVREALEQFPLFPMRFSAENQHQREQQSHVQQASPGDGDSQGTHENRLVERMATAGVDPRGDQRGPLLGLRQGRETGAKGKESLSRQCHPYGEEDQSGHGHYRWPMHPQGVGARPGRCQMPHDQQQLGHQPPLPLLIAEQACPAQVPALERLVPVRHGGASLNVIPLCERF